MKIRWISLEWLIAALVTAMGLLTIVAALLGPDRLRLELLSSWIPLYLPGASRPVGLVAGVFLIMLAGGLGRRQRQAWAVALALLAVAVFAHLQLGFHLAEAATAVGLLVVLLAMRRRYEVGSNRRSLRWGYAVWAAALAVLTTGLSLGPDFHYPWLAHALVWLGGALLLYGLFAMLRPALAIVPAAPGERRRAEEAVSAFGLSAISPYALDGDKAIFSGPHDSGVVAYAVASGVAITAGDPIGPAGQREDLLDAFLLHCRRQGWTPAFYQILPQEINHYRHRSLGLLKIGEDALIDLPSFSLVGKKIANVRHCVTHCQRAGLSVVVYDDGVTDMAALNALEAISTSWLSAKTGGEMAFSLGAFSRQTLRQCPVAVATDDAGLPVAFATFRRYGGHYGVALDLMRRAGDVPSGTMDYLIAQALEHFKARGVAVASLGLAPLANTREGAHGPVAQGLGYAMEWVFTNLNGVYRYKSLYFFKRKFNPRWEPRYLAYPGAAALPHVLYALVRVHLPGAVVALPAWMRRPSSKHKASVALRPAREGAEG